jgi:hypothetical protein
VAKIKRGMGKVARGSMTMAGFEMTGNLHMVDHYLAEDEWNKKRHKLDRTFYRRFKLSRFKFLKDSVNLDDE